MKTKFVETSNVKRFYAGLSALHRRGAKEACLFVIDGKPGTGKTTILSHWASQTGGVYLRAKTGWKPNWMLEELIESLGGIPPFAFSKKFVKCQGQLMARRKGVNGDQFAIVIDEADHISRHKQLIETVRDISDTTRVPTILVGMGNISENLIRFPQVNSRVSQRLKFATATIEDVRLLIDELCVIGVDDELCKFVHRVTKGFNREILTAITSIEAVGLRLTPDADDENIVVGMADMARQFLINDRDTGTDIFVPEVF